MNFIRKGIDGLCPMARVVVGVLHDTTKFSFQREIPSATYLLFLKMADEQTKAPWNKPSPVPEGCDWPNLVGRGGADLER